VLGGSPVRPGQVGVMAEVPEQPGLEAVRRPEVVHPRGRSGHLLLPCRATSPLAAAIGGQGKDRVPPNADQVAATLRWDETIVW
jgi:hypothetical protein